MASQEAKSIMNILEDILRLWVIFAMLDAMLDPKYVMDNVDEIALNLRLRNMSGDPERAAEMLRRKAQLVTEIDRLRARRNDNARAMRQASSDEERRDLIAHGGDLKREIGELEGRRRQFDDMATAEVSRLPNVMHPDVPHGKTDAESVEIARHGDIPKFSFRPLDHVALGAKLDIFDFDRAANVAGPKSYFLKNKGALLELALIQFAIDMAMGWRFNLLSTPDMARHAIADGLGFAPRGDESNIYNIEDEDLCLIGTSEITLGGYHANQLLDKRQLPIKQTGFSHCFRREAGAAGKSGKGLYRVHQFSKVELFAICAPEESEQMHNELLMLEKAIFEKLEIPFRVIDVCSGDLGAPASRKYDLEAWMPGRGAGDWGEVTSASNCGDYQARRLNIRYRDDEGIHFAHMLNGTAIAVPRAIIAILENHQKENGTVMIPRALHPYTRFDRIAPLETGDK